jgi:hypothetical protein
MPKAGPCRIRARPRRCSVSDRPGLR